MWWDVKQDISKSMWNIKIYSYIYYNEYITMNIFVIFIVESEVKKTNSVKCGSLCWPPVTMYLHTYKNIDKCILFTGNFYSFTENCELHLFEFVKTCTKAQVVYLHIGKLTQFLIIQKINDMNVWLKFSQSCCWL